MKPLWVGHSDRTGGRQAEGKSLVGVAVEIRGGGSGSPALGVDTGGLKLGVRGPSAGHNGNAPPVVVGCPGWRPRADGPALPREELTLLESG